MGRVHEFMQAGKVLRRWEIDGEPEVRIVETMTTTAYRGKDYPTTVVAWNGKHMVFDGRNEYLTDRSVVFDAGEKLGVTLTFTELRGIPSTPEEKAEVRRNLDRVIQQIFPGWRLAPEPGESA